MINDAGLPSLKAVISFQAKKNLHVDIYPSDETYNYPTYFEKK